MRSEGTTGPSRRQSCSTLRSRHRTTTALLRALAIAHYQARRYFAAAGALKRADAISRLDPQARFLLADCFQRLERQHWARPELEHLIGDDPGNPLYRRALARIHYDQQRFADGVRELREAIRRSPDSGDTHDLLGQCLEGLGEIREAEAAYRASIELGEAQNDRSPWPYYHLGSLLHDQGRTHDAQLALAEAVEADPLNVPSLAELGIVLAKLRRFPEASEALETAASLDPRDSRILYSLAGVYRSQGLEAKAAEALERFRRLSSAVE